MTRLIDPFQYDTMTVQTEGGLLRMTVTEQVEKHVDIKSFTPDPELVGEPIRVTEAAEKYGITQQTLSNWAKRGMITVINQAPRLLELDEASVARAAAIYKALCEAHSKIHAGRVLKRMLTD
jgi:hypothetical protein